MRRIVLLVAFLYLVWRILSSWGKKMNARARGAEHFSRFTPKHKKRQKKAEAEELLLCSVCGTHVPASSLVEGPERRLCCSEECLKRLRAEQERFSAGGDEGD